MAFCLKLLQCFRTRKPAHLCNRIKQKEAEYNFGTAFANIKMFFKGLGLKKLAPVSTGASVFYSVWCVI